MNVRAQILERISNTRNRAAEAVLEQALILSAAPEQKEIIDIILERNQRSGWIVLIRNFDRLPEEDRARILANPRELFGPLAEAMGDGDGNARKNAIAIVVQTADRKFISLLTDALIDTRPEIRQLAGDALLDAVRTFRADRSADWAVDAPEVQRAVDAAIRGFKTHRQTSAMMAALIFERQIDSPMWLVFNDQYAEATRCANAIFRQMTDPALAPAAFLALGSALKVAALTGLAGCEHPPMVAALIDESFRLLDPKLRTAVEGISNFKFFAQGSPAVRWEKEKPADWLRLIDGLNLPEHVRFALIKRMLDSLGAAAGVAVKMAALRSLAQIQTPEVVALLVHLAQDADIRVARCATRYLIKRKPAEWRSAMPVMLQSRHNAVRRLVSLVSGDGRFDDLWSGYQKLPPVVQSTATRTVATNDAQFGDQLKARLAGTVPDIAQGLKMMAALKSITPFRDQIIALCGHTDPRIVSSAIKLIGRMEDSHLKNLLEAATAHSDARVRANAVEAMDALHIAHTSKHVLELLASRHNRERANAIMAISKFDFATAQVCLIKMLSDPNPLHRISALWVVGHMEILEIVRHVGNMARRDPNSKVRSKADELLQTLQAVAAGA